MKIGNNLVHYLKVLFLFEKPSTQTTEAEQNTLKKYCKNKLIAVEIGVFEGYNTAVMGSALNGEGIVYGIDPFFNGKLGVSFGKLIAQIHIKRSGLNPKVVLIAKLSDAALNDVPDNIDFIFVDGDHSFSGVKKDFELFSMKLAPGGIMAFHDARIFENGWTKLDWGPVRLINEIVKPSNEWEIIEEVDSLVVLKKKNIATA